MMRRSLVILAVAGMAFSSVRAGIGDWKNFTAMNSVRAVASSHDSVWAATSGGAFLYSLRDSSFTRFTNSEGLTTNDVTCVTIDRSGSVWFGESNGSIDVYTPSTGKWRYVRDIAAAAKSQKNITGFYPSGDSLYIATAFGVSLFSLSRFEFIDTYGNFGPLVAPPVTSVVCYRNRVYAATSKGIAVSDPSATNLAAPNSWTSYAYTGSVSSLAVFNSTVMAAGEGGLFAFDGSSWNSAGSLTQPVKIVAHTDALLYVARGGDVSSMTPGGLLQHIDSTVSFTVTGGTIANGRLVLGTDALGLVLRNAASSSWMTAAPDGPASNSFVSLAVDANGVIWSGSGRQYGSGFYSFDGSRWRNYSKANVPGLQYNDAFGVAIGPNNSKWVSVWGGGLVLLNSAGEFVRLFDHTSPGFVGIDTDLKYVVPAVVATDASGTVWTSVYISADLSRVVWKMNPDQSWNAIGAAQGDYHRMLGILVDRNNTKWFSNATPGFPATTPRIVFYNEKLALPGTLDGWGSVSEANGATSTTITSIIEDHDGAIWLGTAVGISVINDPLRPQSITKVFLGAVRDQYINCMAVDAVNNKWIGTASGVFVLSPDGTSLINQYTVANSNGKLVDDNILAIAFDAKNGTAYFGTAKGLSSVGIATTAPAADYSQLSAAPNPFRTWIDPYVTIQGLADGSTIKILTMTGKLVKQFSAQGGGRAFWDGKTESGEQAASGIYIAVAYGENGNSIGRVKLAVIRR